MNTNFQSPQHESDDVRGRMVRELEWFLSRELNRASQVGAKVVAWPTAFVAGPTIRWQAAAGGILAAGAGLTF